MRVVFFGTPDFAVPTLRALVDAPDFEVTLVVSQPDRRRSRNKWEPTPVKAFAEEAGIPVITPEKLNRFVVYDRIEEANPDYLVVVAYGQIIGKTLLQKYKDRFVNIHGSILPKYRGAAPIERAMLAGETETGVTAMLIAREMDAGDMLDIRTTEIVNADDALTLRERLSEIGADLLLETLRNFPEKYASRTPQKDEDATYAAKIEKADGHIDFHASYQEIFNRVRAMKPWPGASFNWGTEKVKVHAISKVKDLCTQKQGAQNEKVPTPGTVVEREKALHIACGDAILSVDALQFPNQKRMSTKAYLLGHAFPEGEINAEERGTR